MGKQGGMSKVHSFMDLDEGLLGRFWGRPVCLFVDLYRQDAPNCFPATLFVDWWLRDVDMFIGSGLFMLCFSYLCGRGIFRH